MKILWVKNFQHFSQPFPPHSPPIFSPSLQIFTPLLIFIFLIVKLNSKFVFFFFAANSELLLTSKYLFWKFYSGLYLLFNLTNFYFRNRYLRQKSEPVLRSLKKDQSCYIYIITLYQMHYYAEIFKNKIIDSNFKINTIWILIQTDGCIFKF